MPTERHGDWTPEQRELYLKRYHEWWAALTEYERRSFVYLWENRNTEAERFAAPNAHLIAKSYNALVNSVLRDCPAEGGKS